MASDPYMCATCHAEGVKLWREGGVFGPFTLLCMVCACREQKRAPPKLGGTDQIGLRVPAVPDGEGSFWGYTSVPDDRVAWWKALPNEPANPTDFLVGMPTAELISWMCTAGWRASISRARDRSGPGGAPADAEHEQVFTVSFQRAETGRHYGYGRDPSLHRAVFLAAVTARKGTPS